MPALLEKSYAHALLFSLGLVLGGVQEPPKKASADTPPAPVPTQTSTERAPIVVSPARAPLRTGAESEELAQLRRADAELFSDLQNSARNPDDAVRERPFTCTDRALERFSKSAPGFLNPEPEASGFWTGLNKPTLPVRADYKVEKYLRYFTQHREGRSLFTAWLRRSGRYSELIGKALREHHLPPELIAVVFIESGFSPTAVSSAGATGLWQFMTQTARAYGLVVDPGVDERRSLWRATEAAARHLADLYEYFRSWDLALAAYNYGYKGLSSRIEQLGTEDFWSLSSIPGALPKETVLYVPKVLAVAMILKNLEAFGFGEIKGESPIEASEIEVPGGVRLSLVARASGTSLNALRALNPEFRKDATPERYTSHRMHIPAAGLSRARVMLDRLIAESEADITDAKVSPDFDWGRDDRTEWKTLLEHAAPSSLKPQESSPGLEAPAVCERNPSSDPERAAPDTPQQARIPSEQREEPRYVAPAREPAPAPKPAIAQKPSWGRPPAAQAGFRRAVKARQERKLGLQNQTRKPVVVAEKSSRPGPEPSIIQRLRGTERTREQGTRN